MVHPYLDYAYTLGKTEGIASLPGFEKGQFAVQDVSSMLVTECALPDHVTCNLLMMPRRAGRPSMRQTDCMVQDAYRRGIFPVIKRD